MDSLRDLVKKGELNILLGYFEPKIVERGKKYADKGRVKEKSILSDNYIHGVVEGSSLYYTDVFLDEGELYVVCTCPYDDRCKHAVALLLSFAQSGDEEPMPLSDFERELKKIVYDYGLLEFNLRDWRSVIGNHSPEEILKFLVRLTKELEEDYEDGYIPYIEEEPLYLDKLVAAFIESLPEGERGKVFYEYLKSLGENYGLLIGSPGRIFKLFSEEDKEVFKALLKENPAVSCRRSALAFTGL